MCTNVAVVKCMDGRLLVAEAAGAEPGILEVIRTAGGIFNLGWPAFGQYVAEYVRRSQEKGRGNLFLVTYHFSRSGEKFGCRGHGYDTDSGIAAAAKLVEQIRRVYRDGSCPFPVDAILMGIETDHQEFIFHDRDNRRTARMSETPDDLESIRGLIEDLYPDMPVSIRWDLLPFMQGNIRRQGKALDNSNTYREHRERVIVVGHALAAMPGNFAIVISDHEPKIGRSVRIAADIIKGNRAAGRIPEDERLLVIASAAFWEEGAPRFLAEERARTLASFCREAIGELEQVEYRACVIRRSDRRVLPLEDFV